MFLNSGVDGFEGSRGSTRVCHQQLSIALNPQPLYEKILTGCLRFAWTLLGSSEGVISKEWQWDRYRVPQNVFIVC